MRLEGSRDFRRMHSELTLIAMHQKLIHRCLRSPSDLTSQFYAKEVLVILEELAELRMKQLLEVQRDRHTFLAVNEHHLEVARKNRRI